MTDPQQDEADIRRALADPQRFTVLYERYFGEVFRFVLRRAGQRELTADLVQNTFLKAMLALPRYRHRGLPFRAWLFRIALNELRMHWRKRREVTIDLDLHQVAGLTQELELNPDPTDLERLATALSRLGPARAQLIHLRFMDGLSFLEMGQVLGIGEDAAKMRTHRVLALLRQYLAHRG
jgi:RNA polymerase sigma-70 factor (ECF subfamily)